MDTVIIGGCFIVALIAIIALAFILRSGQRSQSVSTHESESVTTPTRIEMPIVPSSTQESVPQAVLSIEATEEHHTYVPNGQFHELAVGLHALREQSQEMEQRLSTLTMMIESVERSSKERTLA